MKLGPSKSLTLRHETEKVYLPAQGNDSEAYLSPLGLKKFSLIIIIPGLSSNRCGVCIYTNNIVSITGQKNKANVPTLKGVLSGSFQIS